MINEKRLIDVNDVYSLFDENGFARLHVTDIDSIPRVDAVEVVRCKDCIRRYDTDECPMCFLSGGRYYEFTQDDGFCDRGERKDNG